LLGLCLLLTGLRDFDDMLQLSMQGNNRNVSSVADSGCVSAAVHPGLVACRHVGGQSLIEVTAGHPHPF
jgi:hypothetical protein